MGVLDKRVKKIPLIGYSNRLSVRPSETIDFKVSSISASYFSAKLFRSICADPNPSGQGIVEKTASEYFPTSSFASREQPFYPGSYGVTEQPLKVSIEHQLRFTVVVMPTLHRPHEQTILALDDIHIVLNGDGFIALRVGDTVVSITQAVKLQQWYRIDAVIMADGQLTLTHELLSLPFQRPDSVHARCSVEGKKSAPVSIAARLKDGAASHYFNGKIETPQIVLDGKLIAAWDFSVAMSSTLAVASVGPNMVLKNFPTRAMTGSLWDGTEMCWQQNPSHYGAIHFHEDDIYDFEWDTDFSFTIPADMPSGVYVMRIDCDSYADSMPFYVCATLGKPTAKLCVLISTFTYSVYGNHARPDYQPHWQERIKEWHAYPYNPAEYQYYGLSTYNNHLDGSGICHASHRRPLFNLRPGYITFGAASCSGLRHFQADSHLISWLHAKEIDYDIITDTELHNEGLAAIRHYPALTTATHPEYHTTETLNALRDFRDQGGALHYLGGNGFYWRVAKHRENDSMLEIRRAETGIRAWAAKPGEYYHAFDGTYGGLWQRNGRAPEKLVGIGFVAQGTFHACGYHRTCYDPKFDWVFEGIEDKLIGDFGFSGNGAAGFELDAINAHLSDFNQIVLLAKSATREGTFMLVPEEQLTHLTNLSGMPEKERLHADMIYFEVPGGGTVFATGSITFCGSLPWNNFNNNVSRLLENIISHSIKRPITYL